VRIRRHGIEPRRREKGRARPITACWRTPGPRGATGAGVPRGPPVAQAADARPHGLVGRAQKLEYVQQLLPLAVAGEQRLLAHLAAVGVGGAGKRGNMGRSCHTVQRADRRCAPWWHPRELTLSGAQAGQPASVADRVHTPTKAGLVAPRLPPCAAPRSSPPPPCGPPHQLRHDAADAPHVHRRGVVRRAQQHLGGAVPQRHDLGPGERGQRRVRVRMVGVGAAGQSFQRFAERAGGCVAARLPRRRDPRRRRSAAGRRRALRPARPLPSGGLEACGGPGAAAAGAGRAPRGCSS
jgi:hypothetical protein